jgi:CRP/FNR family transcriptional regulator
VLFEVGTPVDYVYIIGYGAIKLIQILPNGDEVVMHFIPAGGLVAGVVAMQAQARYPLTAVTLEDSGLIKIKSECLRKIISSKSHLSGQLLQMVSARMADLQSEKMVKKSSVSHRVGDFLLRQLAKQPEGYGQKITMRLTRQDIANAVGTSVETVIRILSQWTQEGVIQTQDKHIEILNKAELKKKMDL